MAIAEVVALVILVLFVAWLFSTPPRGGHRPPTKTLGRSTKQPPKPPDAWGK